MSPYSPQARDVVVDDPIGKLSELFSCILVTGGAGFIGSHTSIRLLQEGCRVVVIDELNDYYDVSIKHENLGLIRQTATLMGSLPDGQKRFQFYKADICDKNLLMQIIQNHNVDCIVHLAARAGVRNSIDRPELYVHSNILGSTAIFDAVRILKAGGRDMKHVVYASSSSVYGGNTKVPFSESDMLLNVVSPYAATKLGTEALAMSYSSLSKVKMTGLRFFTVYGPRGRPDMAPFKFVDRICRGIPIDQYGDGSSSRDYTYIDDIVDGICGSLLRPYVIDGIEQLHTVYNLGNSSPVTLNEFISTVEMVCHTKAKIKLLPMQPGDVDRTFADISKAQRDFGYSPQISLKQGLSHLAAWWQRKYGTEDDQSDSAFSDESL
ncbi:hypothetical protein MIR68_003304 [Amoeboaphelidium protococcarum]|nr:hypothetical protein MIR68_003304 [Amoeboaphelidium protococcarum]